jgi:hypothetical protein
MLQLFSRAEFERAVVEHRAERHARGFSCWGQFVAMLFCHLGRAQSLREICGGLELGWKADARPLACEIVFSTVSDTRHRLFTYMTSIPNTDPMTL